MRKLIRVLVLVLFVSLSANAQHQEVSEKPLMYKGKKEQSSDSASILFAFKHGHFNGHFRNFFMATDNKNGLTDYYANAAGGGIRYETARFHGFQFAISGFFVFNTVSSDLGKPDSATGQFNRYELALFDVEDPYNKKDIDRLEEFYLKYHYKKSAVTFGRQLINTPLINLQDGRMRPTGVKGLWVEFNEIKNLSLEAGWLYDISPRATTKWYRPGASIGIYSTGVNPDGTKSLYANNLESNALFMLGAHAGLGKNLKVHGWNLHTENIFNVALFQADANFIQKNKQSLFAAVQFIRQDAVNNGGNADRSRTYLEKGAKAMTMGIRAGWKNDFWETSLNYNRITKHGRYLIPREWGRDPFFTFLPRERNEGFGDVHAMMAQVTHKFSRPGFKTSLAAGYYQLPDVKNYRLNKYGLPSYIQANADIRYEFSRMLTGLEIQLLITGKIKQGETYQNSRYEFNKVNMMNYNLVFNYHF